MKKNILVTGVPGAGKTTLVREVVRESGVKPGGYLTRGMPERGVKTRIEIVALTAGVVPERAVFARIDESSPSHTCGMRVSAAELESVGAVALERARGASPLIVMDEIGHMEIVSPRFLNAVIACLESPTPVLGVIKAKGGPFVDRIKARSDIELVELAGGNYAAVKDRVAGMISALLGKRRHLRGGEHNAMPRSGDENVVIPSPLEGEG